MNTTHSLNGRAGARVVLKAGVLTARGELLRTDWPQFKESCEKLGAGKRAEVRLDLTQCSYMSSKFLGELASSILRLKEQGKRVRVDVSPSVGKMLHMACLFELFDYEICQAGAE